MKHNIVNSLIIASGLALFAGCVTGCNTTKFTKTAAGDVTIENKRFFWSTDSYAAEWGTNGASLNVNKSNVDSAAIAAVADAGAKLAAAAVQAAKP